MFFSGFSLIKLCPIFIVFCHTRYKDRNKTMGHKADQQMMFLQISGSAEHQMAQRISPPYFAWGIWGGSRLIKYHLIIGVSNILINELCMGFKMMLLEWKVQAGAKAVVRPIRRSGNPLVGLHVRRTDYIKKVLLLFLYTMWIWYGWLWLRDERWFNR